MKSGVILIAHGSRRSEATAEMLNLAHQVQEANPFVIYEVAFMQFGSPDIKSAVSSLISQGVNRIVAVPLFLITGNHVTQNIPGELSSLKTAYPAVEFILARHFAGHPALAQIIQDRISEAFLEGEAVGG